MTLLEHILPVNVALLVLISKNGVFYMFCRIAALLQKGLRGRCFTVTFEIFFRAAFLWNTS